MLNRFTPLTLLLLLSSCLSVKIPINTPPKTYAQELKIEDVDTADKNIPSALPAIIAFTIAGVMFANVYGETIASLSGREADRLKASLAGAAVGAPIGAAIGHSIKKQARLKKSLKPFPKQSDKKVRRLIKNHHTLIKVLPTLFLGTIGYMAGRHKPLYSDVKPTDNPHSKPGAVLGSVFGGVLGFSLGHGISNRLHRQAVESRDSLSVAPNRGY